HILPMEGLALGMLLLGEPHRLVLLCQFIDPVNLMLFHAVVPHFTHSALWSGQCVPFWSLCRTLPGGPCPGHGRRSLPPPPPACPLFHRVHDPLPPSRRQ